MTIRRILALALLTFFGLAGLFFHLFWGFGPSKGLPEIYAWKTLETLVLSPFGLSVRVGNELWVWEETPFSRIVMENLTISLIPAVLLTVGFWGRKLKQVRQARRMARAILSQADIIQNKRRK